MEERQRNEDAESTRRIEQQKKRQRMTAQRKEDKDKTRDVERRKRREP